MATAICKLMYNITIHMTGYGVRILLTEKMDIFKDFGSFEHKSLGLPVGFVGS